MKPQHSKSYKQQIIIKYSLRNDGANSKASKTVPRHSEQAVLPKPAITHTTYTKQATDTVGEDFETQRFVGGESFAVPGVMISEFRYIYIYIHIKTYIYIYIYCIYCVYLSLSLYIYIYIYIYIDSKILGLTILSMKNPLAADPKVFLKHPWNVVIPIIYLYICNVVYVYM